MPEQASVAMALPTTGFRRFMFFNRFAVEREEGFVQIHLGMVNKAGTLADSYSAVMAEAELGRLRKSTMEYLGRQGALLEAPPPWQAPAATKVELANHFVMAQYGQVTETIFYAFSHWSALNAAKQDSTPPTGVIAEGMALLRSPLRVQQHLIRLLFPANGELLPSE